MKQPLNPKMAYSYILLALLYFPTTHGFLNNNNNNNSDEEHCTTDNCVRLYPAGNTQVNLDLNGMKTDLDFRESEFENRSFGNINRATEIRLREIKADRFTLNHNHESERDNTRIETSKHDDIRESSGNDPDRVEIGLQTRNVRDNRFNAKSGESEGRNNREATIRREIRTQSLERRNRDSNRDSRDRDSTRSTGVLDIFEERGRFRVNVRSKRESQNIFERERKSVLDLQTRGTKPENQHLSKHDRNTEAREHVLRSEWEDHPERRTNPDVRCERTHVCDKARLSNTRTSEGENRQPSERPRNRVEREHLCSSEHGQQRENAARNNREHTPSSKVLRQENQNSSELERVLGQQQREEREREESIREHRRSFQRDEREGIRSSEQGNQQLGEERKNIREITQEHEQIRENRHSSERLTNLKEREQIREKTPSNVRERVVRERKLVSKHNRDFREIRVGRQPESESTTNSVRSIQPRNLERVIRSIQDERKRERVTESTSSSRRYHEREMQSQNILHSQRKVDEKVIRNSEYLKGLEELRSSALHEESILRERRTTSRDDSNVNIREREIPNPQKEDRERRMFNNRESRDREILFENRQREIQSETREMEINDRRVRNNIVHEDFSKIRGDVDSTRDKIQVNRREDNRDAFAKGEEWRVGAQGAPVEHEEANIRERKIVYRQREVRERGTIHDRAKEVREIKAFVQNRKRDMQLEDHREIIDNRRNGPINTNFDREDSAKLQYANRRDVNSIGGNIRDARNIDQEEDIRDTSPEREETNIRSRRITITRDASGERDESNIPERRTTSGDTSPGLHETSIPNRSIKPRVAPLEREETNVRDGRITVSRDASGERDASNIRKRRIISRDTSSELHETRIRNKSVAYLEREETNIHDRSLTSRVASLERDETNIRNRRVTSRDASTTAERENINIREERITSRDASSERKETNDGETRVSSRDTSPERDETGIRNRRIASIVASLERDETNIRGRRITVSRDASEERDGSNIRERRITFRDTSAERKETNNGERRITSPDEGEKTNIHDRRISSRVASLEREENNIHDRRLTSRDASAKRENTNIRERAISYSDTSQEREETNIRERRLSRSASPEHDETNFRDESAERENSNIREGRIKSRDTSPDRERNNISDRRIISLDASAKREETNIDKSRITSSNISPVREETNIGERSLPRNASPERKETYIRNRRMTSAERENTNIREKIHALPEREESNVREEFMTSPDENREIETERESRIRVVDRDEREARLSLRKREARGIPNDRKRERDVESERESKNIRDSSRISHEISRKSIRKREVYAENIRKISFETSEERNRESDGNSLREREADEGNIRETRKISFETSKDRNRERDVDGRSEKNDIRVTRRMTISRNTSPECEEDNRMITSRDASAGCENNNILERRISRDAFPERVETNVRKGITTSRDEDLENRQIETECKSLIRVVDRDERESRRRQEVRRIYPEYRKRERDVESEREIMTIRDSRKIPPEISRESIRTKQVVEENIRKNSIETFEDRNRENLGKRSNPTTVYTHGIRRQSSAERERELQTDVEREEGNIRGRQQIPNREMQLTRNSNRERTVHDERESRTRNQERRRDDRTAINQRVGEIRERDIESENRQIIEREIRENQDNTQRERDNHERERIISDKTFFVARENSIIREIRTRTENLQVVENRERNRRNLKGTENRERDNRERQSLDQRTEHGEGLENLGRNIEDRRATKHRVDNRDRQNMENCERENMDHKVTSNRQSSEMLRQTIKNGNRQRLDTHEKENAEERENRDRSTTDTSDRKNRHSDCHREDFSSIRRSAVINQSRNHVFNSREKEYRREKESARQMTARPQLEIREDSRIQERESIQIKSRIRKFAARQRISTTRMSNRVCESVNLESGDSKEKLHQGLATMRIENGEKGTRERESTEMRERRITNTGNAVQGRERIVQDGRRGQGGNNRNVKMEIRERALENEFENRQREDNSENRNYLELRERRFIERECDGKKVNEREKRETSASMREDIMETFVRIEDADRTIHTPVLQRNRELDATRIRDSRNQSRRVSESRESRDSDGARIAPVQRDSRNTRELLTNSRDSRTNSRNTRAALINFRNVRESEINLRDIREVLFNSRYTRVVSKRIIQKLRELEAPPKSDRLSVEAKSSLRSSDIVRDSLKLTRGYALDENNNQVRTETGATENRRNVDSGNNMATARIDDRQYQKHDVDSGFISATAVRTILIGLLVAQVISKSNSKQFRIPKLQDFVSAVTGRAF